jgi:hypothetical protein
MADLTTHTAWRCVSTEGWSRVVQGSHDRVYTVSWNNWQHQNPNVEHDYSCTCNAYKYGKGRRCKHILSIQKAGHRCQWDSRFTGEEPIDEKCPCCGEPVIAYSYGA